MTDWRERVVVDDAILAGKPIIRGNRIAVDLLMDRLADGRSMEDMLAAYPRLTRDHVLAAIGFITEVFREEEDVAVDKARMSTASRPAWLSNENVAAQPPRAWCRRLGPSRHRQVTCKHRGRGGPPACPRRAALAGDDLRPRRWRPDLPSPATPTAHSPVIARAFLSAGRASRMDRTTPCGRTIAARLLPHFRRAHRTPPPYVSGLTHFPN